MVAFLIFAAVAIPTCLFSCQMALRSYSAVISLYAVECNSDYYAVTAHKKEIYVFLCASAYNACNTITATIAYIFSIMVFGETLSAALSVIFSSLLFYGGAFMTFSINRIIKNGIACFFVSLIYLAVALLILYGFISVDAEAMKNLISTA